MKESIERSIFWVGFVAEENLYNALEQIKEFAKEDNNAPIKLFITSSGGALEPAIALYDFIVMTGIELHTIVIGEADSAAIVLLAAGKKRSMGPNSRMGLHKGKVLEGGEAFETENAERERYLQILSKASSTSFEEWKEFLKEEKEVDPQEAFRLGIITEA